MFLINPISGTKSKKNIPEKIAGYFKNSSFEIEIRTTSKPGDGFEIAAAEKDNFSAIVAVGGDGSINEIGSALIHSNCCLGVIPAGSGNGLARSLGIPIKIDKALERIFRFDPKVIDAGKVNEHVFLCTAGFGFDAQIAARFDETEKRGFKTYVNLVLKELTAYQDKTYTIRIGEQVFEKKATICTVANAKQFGNGFIISPGSNPSDQQLELIFIERFNLFGKPLNSLKFFAGNIHTSNYFEQHNFNHEIEIASADQSLFPIHADGEKLAPAHSVTVRILKSAIQIL